MLAIPRNDVDILEIDEAAVKNFGMFLLNLLSCILGYKFAYDPSGTVNSGWTAVFG
jgi:hypothetical protein